eukprot:TRINITY_DN11114_c0_g2_i2.p1 TRINITY_DN11114_c0_g2~~TRINITY_DN11114_c0_g2_i2.p1  ORF type:complete len:178 (+),score=57.42 TRINITY_DN11114_c0_g2_i2:47-580(+)
MHIENLTDKHYIANSNKKPTKMKGPHKAEQLSEEKLSEINEVFAIFDNNSDGYVSTEEVGVMVRAVGGNPMDEEIERLKKEIDPTSTGKFDKTAFVALVAKRPKETDTVEDLVRALRTLSEEGDKATTIKLDKFQYYMANRGEAIPEEDIKQLLNSWGTLQGDTINIEEFAKMLMSK